MRGSILGAPRQAIRVSSHRWSYVSLSLAGLGVVFILLALSNI